LLNGSFFYGQTFELSAIAKNKTKNHIIHAVSYKKTHLSKQSVFTETDSILNALEKKGYFNTVLDSVFVKDSLFTAQYILGNKIENVKIYYTNLPQKLLRQISANTTDAFFIVSFEEIETALQHIANYYENNGNTFTQVFLSSITLKNNFAIAELTIHTNTPRTIDKVIVKGYTDFPKNFIDKNLRLKIGSVFNKEKLYAVSASINNLTFVEETKAPEVLFTNDSTYIYLYLKKKKANTFDGVLGFSSEENKSGIEFNGYLDFLFNNIFNSGENISLFWKNNGDDRQRFQIGVEIPYIFNLPIIPKANFELYRQDSTYSNTVVNLDLRYSLKKKGEISALFSTENSSELSSNSTSNILSFSNTFYGASYNYTRLENDALFPADFHFQFSSLFGSRKIESVKTKQSKFTLSAHYLWSIDSKNYIFVQNQSGILNSDNYLENETFRIGGTNSIRGVNEESIFATQYSVFNLEYRYRLSSSSYFYTITDFASIENKNFNKKNNLYSIGLGYAFFTKIGLLNISYANAKFDDNPFSFSNSKLHIKIISFF